jgi:hypothetical protein
MQQLATSQGGYFSQTPQVFQGAQASRSLVTTPATASLPATSFINMRPISSPPVSAQVAGSASVAPPLVSDTKMDCSV